MGLKKLIEKMRNQTDEKEGTALGRFVQDLIPSKQVDSVVGLADKIAESVLRGGHGADDEVKEVLTTASEKGIDAVNDLVFSALAHLLTWHDSIFTEDREQRFDKVVLDFAEICADEIYARYKKK